MSPRSSSSPATGDHPSGRRPLPRRRFLGVTITGVACAPIARWLPATAANDAPDTDTAAARPDPAKPMLVFLLAGQSNMAGRGRPEDQDRQTHPRIWCWNAAQDWRPATEPLHFDKPRVVGVGPGRSFGLAVAEAMPDVQIGLVPAAVGGSPIRTWAPGVRFDDVGVHPYDDAVNRTRAALDSQPATETRLAGVLWHQGESDSGNETDAAAYRQRLEALIQALRDEFEDADLPFLIGELGHFPDRGWSDRDHPVNRAHREIARDLPATAWVSAEGLNPLADGTHFDAPSSREFGRRYAVEWLRLHRADAVARLNARSAPAAPLGPRSPQ